MERAAARHPAHIVGHIDGLMCASCNKESVVFPPSAYVSEQVAELFLRDMLNFQEHRQMCKAASQLRDAEEYLSHVPVDILDKLIQSPSGYLGNKFAQKQAEAERLQKELDEARALGSGMLAKMEQLEKRVLLLQEVNAEVASAPVHLDNTK